jgi:multisubunit Na+/H+ antiporter MnhB subunit
MVRTDALPPPWWAVSAGFVLMLDPGGGVVACLRFATSVGLVLQIVISHRRRAFSHAASLAARG